MSHLQETDELVDRLLTLSDSLLAELLSRQAKITDPVTAALLDAAAHRMISQGIGGSTIEIDLDKFMLDVAVWSGMTAWDGQPNKRDVVRPYGLSPHDLVMLSRRDGRVTGPYRAGRIEWGHSNTDSDILAYSLAWPEGVIAANDEVNEFAKTIDRVEVTIKFYLDHMIDSPCWRWLPGMQETGMDPWKFYEDLPIDEEEAVARNWRIFVHKRSIPNPIQDGRQ